MLGFLQFLLVYLPLCLIAWYVARRKGRCGWCFFLLSFICTPIVGILAVVFARERGAGPPPVFRNQSRVSQPINVRRK